jgi:pyruvate,water dikinase
LWIDLDAPDALKAHHVGGKAASVARLRQAGLPVPMGWCLPQAVEAAWLAEADVGTLIEAIGHGTHEQKWRRPAALLRARLATTPLPDIEPLPSAEVALAVRSSARSEASGFAGQLSTFLGVRGTEALRTVIHACWLSRWSDAILRYAFGRRLGLDDLALAVVVQPMVAAIAAGGARTSEQKVLVEAAWGLGRAVAEARVTPDAWCVAAGEVVARSAGRKPLAAVLDPNGGEMWRSVPANQVEATCLSDDAVCEVARLAREAERVLGPCIEVEFAIDHSGRVWLLQGRLSADVRSDAAAHGLEGARCLAGRPASRGQAIGTARRCASSVELRGDDVLVAEHLLPGAVAGLPRIAGLVLEAGGSTSHVASLARERGIPAVLGARGATQLIADGSVVLVDGDAGRVWFSSA